MKRLTVHGLTMALLIAASLLLLSNPGHAQFQVWEPEEGVSATENTLPTLAPNSLATDDQGRTCVVWSELVDGALAVRGRLLAGDGSDLWASDGIVLAQGEADQSFPSIHRGQGRWYLVWHDFSGDSLKDRIASLRVMALSESGGAIWEDPVTVRENLPTAVLLRDQVRVAADGALLLTGLGHQGNGQWVQRVQEDGSLAWGESGLLVHPELNWSEADALPDAVGGLYLAGSVLVDNSQRRVVVQRISVDGSLLFGENPVVAHYGVGAGPRLLPVTDGAALLVWKSQDPTTELVGQWVEPGGTLPWSQTTTLYQPGEGGVFGWHGDGDGSGRIALGTIGLNSSQEQLLGVQYLQAGPFGINLPWGLDGVQSAHPFGLLLSWDIQVSLSWDALAAVYGKSGEGEVGIYASAWDEQGSQLWGGETTVASYTPGDTTVFRGKWALAAGDAALSVLWSERSGVMRKLRFQRVDRAGGIPQFGDSETLFRSGRQATIANMVLGVEGEQTHVLWAAPRPSWPGQVGNTAHFVQRMDHTNGSLLWPSGGAELHQVDTSAIADYEGDLVSFADGSVVAGWGEFRQEASQLGVQQRVQRLDPAGQRLWGGRGIALFPNREQWRTYLEMLKLSDESLVLASTTGSLAEDTLVTRLQKLDAEGTRLYGDDGIVAAPPGEFVEVAPRLLAPASGGSFWLLLRTVNAAEELEYWLQRVSYDGTVQFTARVADQDASSTARDFRLVTTEGGEAQLLYTRGGTLRYDLVDGSGTVTSTTLLEGPLDAWEAAPAEGGFWVTWNEGAEVRAMRYSTAGTAQLDPPEGLVLPPPLTLPSDLLCVEDGGGGLYVLANNPLESPLLAMHVDEQGDVVNPLYEARPWAVVSDQPRPLFRIQLRKDAQGGFVVAWGADVYTLPGPGSDVMVQRVNDWFVSAPERKEAVPTRFSLSPPWPNPFNPSTTVRITVPSAGHAVVTVHDLLGREVARIHEGRLAPGEYTVRWDGSTHGGVRAASGTYFIHLESGGAAITRKAVLMK